MMFDEPTTWLLVIGGVGLFVAVMVWITSVMCIMAADDDDQDWRGQ